MVVLMSMISSQRFVQIFGSRTGQTRQLEIERSYLVAENANDLRNLLDWNDPFARFAEIQANSRAIWTTVELKMLKRNCGRDADGEHREG